MAPGAAFAAGCAEAACVVFVCAKAACAERSAAAARIRTVVRVFMKRLAYANSLPNGGSRLLAAAAEQR